MMEGSEKRKAPRFNGDMPLLINRSKGITRNLSSSGILFETDGSFSLGQKIEFSIILEHLYSDHPVCLKCQGSIVRVEKSGKKMSVATTIESFSVGDHVLKDTCLASIP